MALEAPGGGSAMESPRTVFELQGWNLMGWRIAENGI